MRKFEKVIPEAILPIRATKGSACYDLKTLEGGTIIGGQSVTLHTGIRAKFQEDEVLLVFSRSGQGCKHHIVLSNGTGVIDSDYYGNSTNGGEILVSLRNEGREPFIVSRGDKVAQCMFIKRLLVDDDKAEGTRTGGFGSTGK